MDPLITNDMAQEIIAAHDAVVAQTTDYVNTKRALDIAAGALAVAKDRLAHCIRRIVDTTRG